MGTVGKALLLAALLLAAAGALFLALDRLGISRLPGDVVVRRENLTVYVPIGLMLLLSVVLTIVLNVLVRR